MGSTISSTGGVTLSSEDTLRSSTVRLFRALIRSNYFGQALPPLDTLIDTTGIPRHTVENALLDLENEDIVARNKSGGYDCIFLPDVDKAGEVAFLLNSDFFQPWQSIFHGFLIGFEQAMHDEHYEVMFRTNFDNVERKADAVRDFHEGGITGLALCSYAEPTLRQYAIEHEIPAIILGNATIHQAELGCVCSDNLSGMAEVVRFLAENGHRHIAYYSPAVRNHDGYQERYIGYEMGMRNAGLNPVNNLVFTERRGSNLATRAATIIQSMHPVPTAVACATDREAGELVIALQAAGLRVPDDVSVVGWGNGSYCAVSEPALTSVDIHSETIGQIAAHYLLNETRGHQIPIRMMLPTQIVIRDSVVGLEYREDKTRTDRLLSKKTARVSALAEDDELNEY